MVLVSVNTVKIFQRYGMQIVRNKLGLSWGGKIVIVGARTAAVDLLVVQMPVQKALLKRKL
jgi:hypothetical protein